MHTDTVSIYQFIKSHQITMRAVRANSNPNMQDSANMDRWKVTFTRKEGNRYPMMTTYFSMGYGHNGKSPSAAEVLDCLASDASTIDNAPSFEDFCGDMGYDSDSRKAEKIFNACEHQANRLRSFLGDAYESLLYGTERE